MSRDLRSLPGEPLPEGFNARAVNATDVRTFISGGNIATGIVQLAGRGTLDLNETAVNVPVLTLLALVGSLLVQLGGSTVAAKPEGI